MWLLNTHSLKLEAFLGDTPSYAILSHRWENEELSFGDITAEHRHLKGYHKVEVFCKEARRNHSEYVWVDTCCIDKKSSAELGEAINSMYMWYEQADICYAYLCDVDGANDIAQSSWFTQGWTLQELLAPTALIFYDCNWSPMASKHELAAKLTDITGIPEDALQGLCRDDFCIAEKMAWAAHRTTTRSEDIAYCLLGLFNINMPLLYGEGCKAFRRLQEEIMNVSTDLSILLWNGDASPMNGILAAAPSCFEKGDRSLLDGKGIKGHFFVDRGWTTNNAGITVRLIVYPYLLNLFVEVFFVRVHELLERSEYGIFLARLAGSKGRATASYRRVTVDGKSWLKLHEPYAANRGTMRQLFITRQIPDNYCTTDQMREIRLELLLPSSAGCTARSGLLANTGKSALRDWPILRPRESKGLEYSFSIPPREAVGLHGHVLITLACGEDVLVCFGFDHNFCAICIVFPVCKNLYAQGLSADSLFARFEQSPMGLEGEGDYYDEVCELYVLVCRDAFAKLTRELNAIGIHVQLNDRRSHAARLRLDPDKFLMHYFPAHADTSPPDNEGPTSIDLAAFQYKFDARRLRDLGWIRP
jgi:hypothetical protein